MDHVTLSNSLPFPEIIFIDQLSVLIGKKVTTIRTCSSDHRYLHLIPRPSKLPGSRRLCWLKTDVLSWLESRSVVLPVSVPTLGRPTKREAIRKAQSNLV